MNEYELKFCDPCLQMTNHLDGVCQKCKPKEESKGETEYERGYSDGRNGLFTADLTARLAEKEKEKKDLLQVIEMHIKDKNELRGLLKRAKSVLDPLNRYYTNLITDIDNCLKP